ncbi:methionyl-tRNA formyltransferase [Paraclostridium ghonii]|uniref:Methionyl-tRNA formyltransferase n=1 Tax=Paraclostridium ghonii TaxID=29358 RepID=A0ABU0MWX2_9FIRM|nr:methionyl-tRNA formyltransferase [Paeniclostridium ghonii]MDQ0555006.1 methionyl-tRNA formyltransferase [Paeniclostridium ghonii]
MKIVFMGTPEFAVPCLQKIIDEGHEVVSVVTQPDKPKGRGKKLAMPPVKELALKYDIPVYQPLKAREESFVETLKEINPELIVVVAFGQILPKSILDIPKYGCVNVHASLLPRYRGAAPLNWVIINGEEKTGVTTMYMDEGLDTGDMILKSEIPLDDEITAGELHDKMMIDGAQVLKETIDLISKGQASREKQNNEDTCYSPIMNKSLGNIDWNKSAKDIHNLIRGINPWPSAYTTYEAQTMKIWKTKVINKNSDKKPGTILSVDKEGIEVSTGEGSIQIKEIQMSGKKRMEVHEYIKGNNINTDVILGS